MIAMDNAKQTENDSVSKQDNQMSTKIVDDIKDEPGEAKSDVNLRQSGELPSEGAETAGKQDDAAEDEVSLTFPQRLMEILDNDDHAEIVSWLHHGKGFMIYNKKRFEDEVLPKYFNKQSKYSSFTRKLNRWGFTRVSNGPESGAFFHAHFRRGGYRLCNQMSCQSGRKSMHRSVSEPAATSVSATSSAPVALPSLIARNVAASVPGQLVEVPYHNVSIHSTALDQAVLQQHHQEQQRQRLNQLLEQEVQKRRLQQAIMDNNRVAALRGNPGYCLIQTSSPHLPNANSTFNAPTLSIQDASAMQIRQLVAAGGQGVGTLSPQQSQLAQLIQRQQMLKQQENLTSFLRRNAGVPPF